MRKHPFMLDTFNFKEGNKFDIKITPSAQRMYGKFKNETPLNPIRSFIGLQSKMYCVDIQDEPSIKRAKGIPKSTVSNWSIENYESCLIAPTNESTYETAYAIRSRLHNLYTVSIKKKSLNSDDRKRVHQSSSKSVPYFHYSLRNIVDTNDNNTTN